MVRKQLREHTFKLLFSTDFYPSEEADEQMTVYLDNQIPDEKGEDDEIISHADKRNEIRERTVQILQKLPELDQKLEEITEGWKLKRIGKPELNILRLAAYEIIYDESIDAPVAINEAVELSKKYGDEGAPRFINGVLAKLVK